MRRVPSALVTTSACLLLVGAAVGVCRPVPQPTDVIVTTPVALGGSGTRDGSRSFGQGTAIGSGGTGFGMPIGSGGTGFGMPIGSGGTGSTELSNPYSVTQPAEFSGPNVPGGPQPPGGPHPASGPGPLSSPDALSSLDSRIDAATAQAARDGAAISVTVHDRATNHTVSSGGTTAIPTASVAKLFIADDLLYQAATGQTQLSRQDRAALDAMLQSSDDDAGEQFWERGGGDGITQRVAARYGLASTGPGSDGRWWNTITTAADLVRYYDMLLDGTGGLPATAVQVILDDLAASSPTGVDGYPQRFGIPDGLHGEPVAVKQGWMCCIGPDWMHLSTGLIGPQHRYVMVIESQQPTDDGSARDTITQVVKAIFPGGHVSGV